MQEQPETIIKTGILDLIAQAGPVVQFVLLVLLLFSVLSWAIIIAKYRKIRSAARQNQKFLEAFWHSKNMDEIYGKSENYSTAPIASVFQSGFRELRKLPSGERAGGKGEVENINRAMMRASNNEVGSLEKHVGWLATTASATPFIGLFGTVWGIMNSFRNIGITGSANLAVVAPGISEALVATAIGLGAAIPAVVAYNHFSNQIRRIAIDVDCFVNDFLNIVQRSFMNKRK